MPKSGNIFTKWFKSNKQKYKKSKSPIKNQVNAIESSFEPVSSTLKRSPLASRSPTNDYRNKVLPKRKTSMFSLTFGLASSTGSSRLSLFSNGNNSKQSDQHRSTSCIESQFQNQMIEEEYSNNRKYSINIETNSNNNIEYLNSTQQINNLQSKSPYATSPKRQSKSKSITSANFFRQLALQLEPKFNDLTDSSIQNVEINDMIQNHPKLSTNNQVDYNTNSRTNQTVELNQETSGLTINESSSNIQNSSLKQTSAIFNPSLNKNSAFASISNLNADHNINNTKQKRTSKKLTTTQQQKQIQFKHQHYSNIQPNHIQKLIYNQQLNNNDSINIKSSGLITTINESFTELNQDSSDTEIIEAFASNEKKVNKIQNDTLDLVDDQLSFGENDEKNIFYSRVNKTKQQEKKKDDQQNNSNESDQTSYFMINEEESVDEVKKKYLTNKTDILLDECKLNNHDILIDNSKVVNETNLDNLEDNNKALKRKSIDIVDLGDFTQQHGEEEADIFGKIINNEEDFSLYENRTGLGEDMKFLASMPELCDITFLVGETREPVCAVRAVLGSRSKVFSKLLYGQKNYSNQQYNTNHDDLQAEKSIDSVRSTRRSIFGRKENIIDEAINMNNSKRSKDESITGGILRYSKSKKFKENRDTKLKSLLKRGSESQLNGIPITQIIQPPVHQTMIIEEFEPDVFRQLIEYIHTGCVTLQARTLLGLMNAADYYGLEELRKACMGFVNACITVDTVCALLASAERYIQYKCTKSLVQRVLEFVDNHGNEVLSLGSFALLPEHVVRLILSREELKADELVKFQATLQWSQRYCVGSPSTANLREVMQGFFECIEFYKIPATVLMREVHPLNIVPDHIIMNALAYQADPKSIDIRKVESPNRFRRMTLPHALNISGSELLNLHRQSLIPFKQERSASTSTSGYNTECSMSIFSANNTSSGNLGFTSSIKRKKDTDCDDGPNNEEDNTSKSKSKDKIKDKQNKIGKRRGSRPFRRAMTLFEGKKHTE